MVFSFFGFLFFAVEKQATKSLDTARALAHHPTADMLQTAVQLCSLFGRQAGPESTFASLSRLQQTSENARIVNQADLYHDLQGREVPGSLKRNKVSVDIFPRRDFSRYEDEILAEQTCCDVLVHVALYQTIPETRGVPVRGLNWPSYEDDVKIQEGWDNSSKSKTAQTPPAYGNTYSFLASTCSSD